LGSTLKLEAIIPLKEALVVDFTSPLVTGGIIYFSHLSSYINYFKEHGFEIVHAGQKKWQFIVDKPEDAAALKKLLTETLENAYSEVLNAK
jgi:hypothetical protein